MASLHNQILNLNLSLLSLTVIWRLGAIIPGFEFEPQRARVLSAHCLSSYAFDLTLGDMITFVKFYNVSLGTKSNLNLSIIVYLPTLATDRIRLGL